MAQISKSHFIKTREWAKHLRPWGKKAFNKAHRRAAKRSIDRD